jgi:hypothetical protein
VEVGSVTAMSDHLFAWDFADDFTGLEAASLIVGITPSVDAQTNPAIGPVLNKMREAHDSAMLSVSIKGMGAAHDGNVRLLESLDFDAHRRWLATPFEINDVFDEALCRITGFSTRAEERDEQWAKAGQKAWDERNKALLRLRLREAAGGAVPTAEEVAAASFVSVTPPGDYSEMHKFNAVDFDLARFGRNEVHRWITANKYPTQYQFERVVMAITKKTPSAREDCWLRYEALLPISKESAATIIAEETSRSIHTVRGHLKGKRPDEM